MNLKNVVKRLLAEKENRRYEKLLRSRQGSYQDWITALERKQEADGEPCEVRQVGKAQSCKEQVGKAQDGKAQGGIAPGDEQVDAAVVEHLEHALGRGHRDGVVQG